MLGHSAKGAFKSEVEKNSEGVNAQLALRLSAEHVGSEQRVILGKSLHPPGLILLSYE